MRWPYLSTRMKLGVALAASSLISFAYYFIAIANGIGGISYLPWNLLLAWISLLMALWVERTVHQELWSSWYALAVTALWLTALPNAFYMLSDLVHIQDLSQTDLLYGCVVFASFIINGLILGLLSLSIVHLELRKRISDGMAYTIVGVVIAICSFAIYVGRDLRYNAWDIVLNPASVLFDVSDKLLHPAEHPQMFVTTISFFALIASLYAVLWSAAKVARRQLQD